jgi:hypothetical protein
MTSPSSRLAAVLHRAIQLLRKRQLANAYAAARAEWKAHGGQRFQLPALAAAFICFL